MEKSVSADLAKGGLTEPWKSGSRKLPTLSVAISIGALVIGAYFNIYLYIYLFYLFIFWSAYHSFSLTMPRYASSSPNTVVVCMNFV